ncbi:Uncharacterised protein [Mycobacteroides abscessus subsp. abscessus]|nr:Uncharacterised protein [Mycobacteroides abscessus subsp. abscessus]
MPCSIRRKIRISGATIPIDRESGTRPMTRVADPIRMNAVVSAARRPNRSP